MIAHPPDESTLPAHPTPLPLVAATCPRCGTQFAHALTLQFSPALSGILDGVQLVEDDLRQLKAALEEVIL
jgi:hypothetical protein